MKALLEILKALYSIKDAIIGKQGGNQESGGKKEYFKIVHAPIGVGTGHFESEEILLTEYMNIDEFWNKHIVQGIPIDDKEYFFIYDEIPSPADLTTIYTYDGFINLGWTTPIENPRDNWHYSTIIDHPGKYMCGFGG